MRHILYIVLLFIFIQLKAQQPSYIHFSPQNGLPGNTVYYCYQDQEGYIWFATDKGVARYNGYGFTVFNANDGLSDNQIFDIFQDSQKRIWFACQNGELSYYFKGKFYNKSNSAILSKVKTYSTGLKIFEDDKNNLFYLTQNFLVRIKDDSVTTYELKDDNAYSTMIRNDKNEVFTLSYSRSDISVVKAISKKEMKFSHGNKEVMPRLNTKADLISANVVFSSNDLLVQKSLLAGQYKVLKKYDQMLQFVRKVDDEHLWVGTQKGLFLFSLRTAANEMHWFKENSISCAMKDREGNIWVTSLDNGVFLLLNPKTQLLDNTVGLTFRNTHRLIELDSSTTLIGSDYFRFALIQNSSIKNMELPQREGNGLIRNARKDRQGNIYVFTSVNLMKLNNNFEVVKTYKVAIRDIYFDRFDSVYIARTNGLAKVHIAELDRMENELDAFIHSKVRLKTSISFLFIDKKEKIHAVGGKGVIPFEKGNSLQVNEDPLFSVNITDIVQSTANITFIASGINGIKLIYKGNEFYVNTKNGLGSNFVTSLVLDKDENLWAGTSAGISFVRILTNGNDLQFKIKNFSMNHGLPENTVNDLSFNHGKIWASTASGLCMFEPEDFGKDLLPPKLVIERITFKDSLMDPEQRKFRIPFAFNHLNVDFIAISIGAQGKLKYRYSMKGLEESSALTTDLNLHYPSLAPGIYTLEINAMNEDGRESEPMAIEIEIMPEWYQTLAFKFLLFFIMVILIYTVFYYRNRSWKRNQQLKESLLIGENKRLELEQKALRLHMNPHFIFNAINSIDGFYAAGEHDAGKRYINRFSKILRTLLDNSSHKFISLQKEEELLVNYLELNKLRFADKFDYTITIEEGLDKENTAIPPMILQPFVENAIIHGIAPLKKKGSIEVSILTNGKFLKCEIKDNGIGLARSKEINKGRIHLSTGINVSIERIKANCSLKENVFEIRDQIDQEGYITGTCVCFQLDLQSLY